MTDDTNEHNASTHTTKEKGEKRKRKKNLTMTTIMK